MPDQRGAAGHPSAHQRAHARLEHLEFERLGEVIIGARIEAGHQVLDAVQGRENEHRHGGLAQPEALEHLEPRALGQPDVEDEQVEIVGLKRCLGLLAVLHLIDRIPGLAQRPDHGFGHARMIFGNQYVHSFLLWLSLAKPT